MKEPVQRPTAAGASPARLRAVPQRLPVARILPTVPARTSSARRLRLADVTAAGRPTRLEAALLRIGRTETATDADAAPPALPRPSDRRAYPRHDSGSVVWVYRCDPSEFPNRPRAEWLLHAARLKGRLIDVSMNGVAFLVPEPLDAESHLLLRLANPRLDRHIDIEADVLRVIAGQHGWKIVCRLRRHLSLEQVVQLGRHLFDSRLV